MPALNLGFTFKEVMQIFIIFQRCFFIYALYFQYIFKSVLLAIKRLYSSSDSVPVDCLPLQLSVTCHRGFSGSSPGHWRLPCEWSRQRGDVWCHTMSDIADRTASHGPAPSEWPGTGLHPSTPSPSIWRSTTSSHKRLEKLFSRRESLNIMYNTHRVL